MPDVEIIEIRSQLIGGDLARARLDAMQIALADMRGPIKAIINDMQDQADAQFATLGAAAETPWAPLSLDTIRNKMAAGYPAPGWPLVATGELRESAVGHGPYGYGETMEQQGSYGLDMERDGWNIAALQQFGVPWEMVHRRAYETRSGHHIGATSYMWHLPPRPMLVASEELLQDGADRIVEHVFNPLGF